MKKPMIFFALTAISCQLFGWGQNGHRIVGLIAERHLSETVLEKIRGVLQDETLAEVSTYMDFIKSDAAYRHMSPWHYATIPDDQTYKEAGTPKKGDIIQTIDRLIKELKSKKFTDADEAFALKCLIHLIGDIHQPLHIGNGEDKGGTEIQVKYFGKQSNLHKVWDTNLIEGQSYSYTEYVEWINHPSDEELRAWSSLNVLDWANESKEHRKQCYETMPYNRDLGYRYSFENIALLNQRLLQAGVRLANVLDDIYG